MRSFKVSVRFVSALIALCFSVLLMGGASAGVRRQARFVSDGQKRIVLIEKDDSCVMLRSYLNGAMNDSTNLENICFEDCLLTQNTTVLLGRKKGNIVVSERKNHNDSVYIIEGSDYNTGCAAVTYDRRLYISGPDANDTVRRFDMLCSEIEPVKLAGRITGLFYDSESKKVFALSAGGVYDADSGEFIPCKEVPSLLGYAGGYYWDTTGTVFSFDSTSGFKRLFSTGHDIICACTDGVLVYDKADKTVFLLDSDGNAAAGYYTELTVSEMAADRYHVVLLADSGEDIVVSLNDFEPVQTVRDSSEEPVSEETSVFCENSAPENTSSASAALPAESKAAGEQQSRRNREYYVSAGSVPAALENTSAEQKPSHELSSSSFRIDGSIIYVPQGTTAAQLKKGLDYGSGSLTITNHNGVVGASGRVGTGWTLEHSFDSGSREYKTVVRGDVTGEGNINTNDLRRLADLLLSDAEPERAVMLAGDIDGDGTLSAADLYLIHSGRI